MSLILQTKRIYPSVVLEPCELTFIQHCFLQRSPRLGHAGGVLSQGALPGAPQAFAGQVPRPRRTQRRIQGQFLAKQIKLGLSGTDEQGLQGLWLRNERVLFTTQVWEWRRRKASRLEKHCLKTTIKETLSLETTNGVCVNRCGLCTVPVTLPADRNSNLGFFLSLQRRASAANSPRLPRLSSNPDADEVRMDQLSLE